MPGGRGNGHTARARVSTGRGGMRVGMRVGRGWGEGRAGVGLRPGARGGRLKVRSRAWARLGIGRQVEGRVAPRGRAQPPPLGLRLGNARPPPPGQHGCALLRRRALGRTGYLEPSLVRTRRACSGPRCRGDGRGGGGRGGGCGSGRGARRCCALSAAPTAISRELGLVSGAAPRDPGRRALPHPWPWPPRRFETCS